MAQVHAEDQEPSAAWAVWQTWYEACCWGVAMLLAPVWAIQGANRRKVLQNMFSETEAVQEALLKHLKRVADQIDEADKVYRVLDLASAEEGAAAKAARDAFLAQLAATEQQRSRLQPRGDFSAAN